MHKLIFEGAELTGKSYTIYPVWNALEKEANTGFGIMDGCIWINADIGIFGSDKGWDLVEKYIEIAELLNTQSIIFEKLHLTNHIYTNFADENRYEKVTQKLHSLGFKTILTTTKENPTIFDTRISDRLKSNTAYERIAKPANWYIEQQRKYIELAETSTLPHLIIDNTEIPNNNYKKILEWLEE